MRLAIVDDQPTGGQLAADDAPKDVEAPDEPAVGEGEGDAAPAPEAEAEDGVGEAGQHEWLLVVEGVETGDGRVIDENALTWRDLPLPLMATDETSDGHDGAKLVGQIVDIRRDGANIYGTSVPVESDDDDVKRLQGLIDRGELRGVSVDMDSLDAELEVIIPADDEPAEPEVDDDGNEMVRIPMGNEKLRIRSARIMGATAVPFPAFQEAGLISSALTAGAITLDTEQPDGSFPITAPVAPPAHFFDDPGFMAPTPMSVENDGYVRGHIALWNTCHRGFSQCTPPPRAPGGDYSQFHTGEIVTAEGSRLSVGNITVDSGHAPLDAGAAKAIEHYDHTGWIGADIRVGEDEFGIWAAGALRPDVTPAQVRALLAADVSGDWRSIDGRLRLIGLCSVPVPGFVKTRVASGAPAALVAAVPVCTDDLDADTEYVAMADYIAASIGRDRETLAGERDRVAYAIGRHPVQLTAAANEARRAIHASLAADIAAEVR